MAIDSRYVAATGALARALGWARSIWAMRVRMRAVLSVFVPLSLRNWLLKFEPRAIARA